MINKSLKSDLNAITVSLNTLKDLGACEDGLKWFTEQYGGGKVRVSIAKILEDLPKSDWAVQLVCLTRPGRSRYIYAQLTLKAVLKLLPVWEPWAKESPKELVKFTLGLQGNRGNALNWLNGCIADLKANCQEVPAGLETAVKALRACKDEKRTPFEVCYYTMLTLKHVYGFEDVAVWSQLRNVAEDLLGQAGLAESISHAREDNKKKK